MVAGGLTVVSAVEVLSRWSSFDQVVATVQTCLLPAGTSLIQVTDSCVCLTVQAESLSALKNLWKLYQDRTLQKRLCSQSLSLKVVQKTVYYGYGCDGGQRHISA